MVLVYLFCFTGWCLSGVKEDPYSVVQSNPVVSSLCLLPTQDMNVLYSVMLLCEVFQK